MSSVQHLVPPKLPTVLVNNTHVDLPGYDLWFNNMNHVHVVPTVLDVAKFESALSRVLQLYPHAAGQLRCADGRWSIELTNTGVPVDIEHKPGMNCDSLLHDDCVVQDDLSPLLNQLPIGIESVNSNAPLLRLKLTLLENETCMGISWSHMLGDAMVVLRFIHTLSQFYQDLPREFAAPTFEKYQFPAQPPVLAEFEPYMPVYRHFDLAAFLASYEDSAHVAWHIDTHDLEELRSAFGSRSQSKIRLSKQDCLTAYILAVLNQSTNKPIQKVINASSYRHINASFISENAASNSGTTIHTNVPIDMAEIAFAVRDALIQCRKPDCVFILQTLKSNHMLEAANNGKMTPFAFDDSELLVNSHGVIDWCSAHFGCPDGTRFYMAGVYKNLLRCFKSNPVKGDDGIWRARQSMDISIGVPAKLKPKVLETLARGVRYLLDNQDVTS